MGVEGNAKTEETGAMVPEQNALLKLMMLTSAADGALSERELGAIADLCRTLPVFAGLNYEDVIAVSADTSAMLDHEDGVDHLLEEARTALPERLHPTAYALAVEIAVSDRALKQEELRLLDMIATQFSVDPVTRASVEESARVRHRKLDAGA